MRVNSNAISFFLLILAEKKRVGATSIFSTFPIKTGFYFKCLISEKQKRFFLGAKLQITIKYSSHMRTSKIIHNN